eukprot:9191312-Pyramimonas_sp.AAC.1
MPGATGRFSCRSRKESRCCAHCAARSASTSLRGAIYSARCIFPKLKLSIPLLAHLSHPSTREAGSKYMRRRLR